MPNPEPETLRVTLPSDTGYLHLVANLARNAAAAAGLGEADADKVALATDEAVSNVIRHAYHNRKGRTVELVVKDLADRLEIYVIHDGDPVDTDALPVDINLDEYVKDRRTGGLGVVLMARLMDEVDYRTTDDDRNACCLSKFKAGAETAAPAEGTEHAAGG